MSACVASGIESVRPRMGEGGGAPALEASYARNSAGSSAGDPSEESAIAPGASARSARTATERIERPGACLRTMRMLRALRSTPILAAINRVRLALGSARGSGAS